MICLLYRLLMSSAHHSWICYFSKQHRNDPSPPPPGCLNVSKDCSSLRKLQRFVAFFKKQYLFFRFQAEQGWCQHWPGRLYHWGRVQHLSQEAPLESHGKAVNDEHLPLLLWTLFCQRWGEAIAGFSASFLYWKNIYVLWPGRTGWCLLVHVK